MAQSMLINIDQNCGDLEHFKIDKVAGLTGCIDGDIKHNGYRPSWIMIDIDRHWEMIEGVLILAIMSQMAFNG